jgi:hypothetical protein
VTTGRPLLQDKRIWAGPNDRDVYADRLDGTLDMGHVHFSAALSRGVQ